MKRKVLVLSSVAIAVCAVLFANVKANATMAGDCGVSACGGGNTKCCSDKNGNTFYLTKAQQ